MRNTEAPFHMITGPCAGESRDQMLLSAREAQKRGFEVVRMPLWKPRTKPGFEGLGLEGISILLEVAQTGIVPATEVLLPEHAEAVLNGVIQKDNNTHVLLWLGSRSQIHLVQRDVGSIIAGENRVKLLIKNQMWKDKMHWEGIVEHVLSGGAKPEQLLLCHRGFAPASDGLRNPPDLDLALEAQADLTRQLGVEIPLIADPSHIAGGSPENVMNTALALVQHEHLIENRPRKINGLMIEVHPDPIIAQTDAKQQLCWSQLDMLIEHLNMEVSI